MKITIAICDDEEICSNEIKTTSRSILNKMNQEHTIEMFGKGQDLFQSKMGFDIILLDIEMPGMSGFELAELLNKEKNNAKIIFVSNFEEMVFSSFQYQPFRFVRKEKIEVDLEEAMLSCVKEIQNEKEVITLKAKAGEVVLNTSDIIYAEIYGHELSVIHRTGKVIARGTLKELEKSIRDVNFVRTHKSYIVNMKYAYCILKGYLQLDNDKKIPLSKKWEEEVKKRFQYTAGFMIENNPENGGEYDQ